MWARHVQPARIDSAKVCAHVAVHTLVEPDAVSSVDVYGYHVDFVDRIERRSGRTRMVAGVVRVRSQLTEIATALCFAGLHLGEQHVTGGVRPPPERAAWASIVDALTGAFKTADVFAAQRAIDRHFRAASCRWRRSCRAAASACWARCSATRSPRPRPSSPPPTTSTSR